MSLSGFQDHKILDNIVDIDIKSYLPFEKKDVILPLTDQGSQYGNIFGSVTGPAQIQFNTQSTSVSPGGILALWSESWLSIPLCCTFAMATGAISPGFAIPLGIKNGSWQFVDSFLGNFQGQVINNQTGYQNIINNYLVMTQMNPTRLQYEFPGCHIQPDTVQAGYICGPTSTTLQEFNNRVTVSPADSGTSLQTYNVGARMRATYLNNFQYWAYQGNGTTGNNGGQNSYVTYTPISVTEPGGVVSGGNWSYNINIILPLKFMHSFWANLNMPLMNVQFTLQINLNLGQNSNTNPMMILDTATLGGMNVSTFGNSSGSVVPGYVAPAAGPPPIQGAGGGYLTNTGTTTVTFTPSAVNTFPVGGNYGLVGAQVAIPSNFNMQIGNTAGTASSQGSIRWFYPFVVLQENQKNAYLKNYSDRLIKYIDPQNINFFNQNTSLTASAVITTAIVAAAGCDTLMIKAATPYLVTRTPNSAGVAAALQLPFSPVFTGMTMTLTGTGAASLGTVAKVLSPTQLILTAPAAVTLNGTVSTGYGFSGYPPSNLPPTNYGPSTTGSAAAFLSGGAISTGWAPSSATNYTQAVPYTGTSQVVLQFVPTIPNIRRITVHAFMASAVCPSVLSPLKSPFSASPGTLSSPGVSMYNFNCAVNGVNIFQNPITNSMWAWYQIELQQLRGGASSIDYDQSGLFSADDYLRGGQVLDFDLTRIQTYLKNPALGITMQITYTNGSGFPLDNFCFLHQEKCFKVSVIDGVVTNVSSVVLTTQST